jgi:hypothetical protein
MLALTATSAQKSSAGTFSADACVISQFLDSQLVRVISMRSLGLAIAFISCGWAHAQNLSIESKNLRAPPADTVALISTNQAIYEKNEFARCTLVGKPFVEDKLWIVTVKGCPVGNNAGPIWIVLYEDGRSRIVHEQDYFSVEVADGSSHGLPNLTWTSSTAAFYVGGLLQYNGEEYISSEARMVNLNDPAECRASQDICKR